ncbi:MAG: ATP-binding protein, partial [Gallionellaceae bacterium]|nr:ATP-binding protein [Gallionellaceae bacterium]
EVKQSNGYIFVVFYELFSNSLDHGILKIDSALKHVDYIDMEVYFDERANRIANLEHGKIEMHLEKLPSDNGQLMKIHIKDSGEGFDFTALKIHDENSSQRLRQGRGITLLKSTCNAIQYLGNGSEVVVYLELPAE